MPREDCFLFWEMWCEERWQGGGGLAFLKGKRRDQELLAANKQIPLPPLPPSSLQLQHYQQEERQGQPWSGLGNRKRRLMSSVHRVGVQLQGPQRMPRGWASGSRKARMGGAMRDVQEPSRLCALPGVPKVNLSHLL